MSECGCELEDAAELERTTLKILLAINGVMFLVEAVAGWWGESTGLLADSLDMLADAFVYGVALYAVGRSQRLQANAATASGVLQVALGIGVLVEVNCETDFSAKTEDFTNFAKNLAMHIAATNPLAISPENLPLETMEREKEIYRAQAIHSGKEGKVVEKIVEGRLRRFFSDVCLLNQAYVKDPALTIQDLLDELKAKTGENIIKKSLSGSS